MFASQAVNLLIEQLVINTEKKMVSLITQCLQQLLKSGSVKIKAPVTPGLPDPSKGYVFC